jgi:hypothetical protein
MLRDGPTLNLFSMRTTLAISSGLSLDALPPSLNSLLMVRKLVVATRLLVNSVLKDGSNSLNNIKYRRRSFFFANHSPYRRDQMLQAVYTFAIFGAFILGGVISWIAKEYVDAYIDNAHYAKSITHPEMLNEDGTVNQEELIYLRFTDDDATLDDEDDD